LPPAQIPGQAAFTEFLALPAGVYRLKVAVKDVSNAVVAVDEFTFEVNSSFFLS